LISVKRFFVLLTFLLPLAQALAEGVPFTIAGDDAGEDTVSQLKQKAVVNYLQRQMGSRYASVAEQVTPEFAENYILDYQVGKKGRQTEVTGHLDAKSLMRWVRLSETKSRSGGAIRTAFVLTSEFPQAPLQATETAARIKEQPAAKVVHELTLAAVDKFNVTLTGVDQRFPLSTPARQESELRSLRDFGASAAVNTVLWVHLSPCPSCGGGKISLYFYSLFQDRPAVVESRNLKIDATQLTSGQGLKEDLGPSFTDFAAKLEDVISSGALSSRIYRVIIENIRTYKGFRQLQEEMNKLDFVAKATLKRTEPFVAEYEVFSPMSANDISQRFQATDFEGFTLQAVKADAASVTLKLQPR
jgi:hypothetical protein